MRAGVGILFLEEVHERLQPLERELLDPVRLLLHAPLQRAAVVFHLQREAPLVERLHHPGAHFIEVERLGDVVECPELQAGDRALDLGDGGHDDDGGVGPARDDLTQQRHAVHLRHPQVGDHERHALLLQQLERLGAGPRFHAGESFALE